MFQLNECHRWGIICLCLIPLITGCSSKKKTADVVKVNGTVTVDGEPLSSGVISFDPEDGVGGAYGTKITSGSFTVEVSPGPKQISIIASRPTGGTDPFGYPAQEQFLPARYNVKSTLKETINRDSPNELKFELTTKK